MKLKPRLPQIAKKPQEPTLGEILRGPGEDPKLSEAQRAGISAVAQLGAIDRERHEAGAAARAEQVNAKLAADDAA